ncbi:MAG: preQ(1) synthase [Chloroflexi bacterium]|nr:preQ(1) synthase [Chloroflexota bacterium]
MPSQPSKALETFPNPHPSNRYVVTHVCPEYTAVCPITGQPDFGTIRITYIPAERCVELKSLKLYLWSFRNEGHFFEDVTNIILNDLVRAIEPIRCEVVGEFNVRGGIRTTVTATYEPPAMAPRA